MKQIAAPQAALDQAASQNPKLRITRAHGATMMYEKQTQTVVW